MFAAPADLPVTTPAVFIDAIPVLLLLHVPLPVRSFSVVVDPAHTELVPVMPAGCVFTI